MNKSISRTYTLKGLDCPNCAAMIESTMRAAKGVNTVSVNPVTSVLNVEFLPHLSEKITALVEQAVQKHEPDVTVIDNSLQNVRDETIDASIKTDKTEIIKLATGAVIFAAGLIIERIFFLHNYTRLAVYMAAYVILGGGIVARALKNLFRGQIFDENFLMTIATAGAFAIGEYPEAAGVMLFYQIGELFQKAAIKKSKKSITGLMTIRPDYANLKKDNEIIKVDPGTISVGSIIIVKPGEKIPLDGIVIEGASTLDTKALTGESVPKRAAENDAVLSGCVNLSGKLMVKVTKTFGESTVSKIINLVENASVKKAKTENFITSFARIYTPIVVTLAILVAILPPLILSGVWKDWINRALVFLVISCPCALVLSIPMSFFAGIGRAARSGILIKGGNFLEAFNSLEMAVFDKTGTLTKGVFKVTSMEPAEGFTKETLLELAANAEAFSNHPIALSILDEYGNDIKQNELSQYSEFPGLGTSVMRNEKTILAGSGKFMEKNGIKITESSNCMGTKVYAVQDNVYAGCISISDEIKADSKRTISLLKERGVQKTVMLTGDNRSIAELTASELGIDEVYGGLLPHEKVEKLEMLSKQKTPKGRLAFLGDGINDAPVLAMADIGVAMGGLGSDAAIEAADVVLMTDETSKLADAVDIAKFTKKIVLQNIVFALGVKTVFMALGAFGIATMWEAVFADVGVSLLAVINAMRITRFAHASTV